MAPPGDGRIGSFLGKRVKRDLTPKGLYNILKKMFEQKLHTPVKPVSFCVFAADIVRKDRPGLSRFSGVMDIREAKQGEKAIRTSFPGKKRIKIPFDIAGAF